MYELIGSHTSRAFRVMWMLEELEVDYTWASEKPHSPRVRELSRLGKIPILMVNGEPLTDSAAIIQFLADHHGRFTRPAGTIERARQDGLLHQVLDELDAVLWVAARHSFILPEAMRVPEIKPSLAKEFARNAQALADRMRGPFLMGEDMTVPDIFAAHCLNWARAAKFEFDCPALVDYGKRMRERPAFQRATEKGKAAA